MTPSGSSQPCVIGSKCGFLLLDLGLHEFMQKRFDKQRSQDRNRPPIFYHSVEKPKRSVQRNGGFWDLIWSNQHLGVIGELFFFSTGLS